MIEFFRFTYPPAVTVLLVAALINAALAICAFRRRDVPHATAFAWTMVVITLWTLSNAAEFASVESAAKLFWLKFKYLGSAGAPALWLVFSLRYVGEGKRLTRRNLALLGLWVLVVWLLVFTNDAHGLIWQDIWLAEPSLGLSVVHGRLFWVYCVFAYAMVLIASFFYILVALRSPELYRWQAVAMLFCGLLPLAGGLDDALGLRLFPDLDPAIVGFSVTGLVIAWALLRYQLLDVVPVAHSFVIESMAEGMIVMDRRDRILEINSASQRILSATLKTGLGVSASEAVGQPIEQVCGGWPDLLECFRRRDEGQCEDVTLDKAGTRRIFAVEISPLTDRRDQPIGRLALLRDVTARKQAEAQRLQQRALATLEERERLARELHDGLGLHRGYHTPACARAGQPGRWRRHQRHHAGAHLGRCH